MRSPCFLDRLELNDLFGSVGGARDASESAEMRMIISAYTARLRQTLADVPPDMPIVSNPGRPKPPVQEA